MCSSGFAKDYVFNRCGCFRNNYSYMYLTIEEEKKIALQIVVENRTSSNGLPHVSNDNSVIVACFI